MTKGLHSHADYSPANLAKSMESFHSILNGRVNNGIGFDLCAMTFIYDTILGLPHDPDNPNAHERIAIRKHPACTSFAITHL